MPLSAILNIGVIITIDGLEIAGVTHASVVNTNSYTCDTFSITLVAGEAPLTTLAFWAEMQSGVVEIIARSNDKVGSRSLIVGQIDAVHIEPLRRFVVIDGRDLSASLIDAYRQQDFVNQTASEIVATIAEQHGLQPVVTSTVGSVGRYYTDGFTRLSLGQYSKSRSDWDIIVGLARQYGFDVFAQGRCLCFQSPTQLTTLPIRVSTNGLLSIRIERQLRLDLNSNSRIQSWNSQDMAAYSNQPAQIATTGANQAYLFTGANLTIDQVDAAAIQLGAELSRLRTVLHFETPWNLEVGARSLILLTGTCSSIDALYIVDRVEWDYSAVGGSIQRIQAIVADQPLSILNGPF